MCDHKDIFWNSTYNGWSILWFDKKDMIIRSKTIRSGARLTIICPECNIEVSRSSLRRHYKRKHKDKPILKLQRRKPTIIPPDTPEVKEALEKIKRFAETIPDDNIIEMSVMDYMKLNKTTKSRLSGYIGKCVEWSHRKVELNPYVLGLWLGDGFKHGCGFALNPKDDPEIYKYLIEWGQQNDAKFKKVKNQDYYYSISSLSKCLVAPLKKQLSKYDLVNNKHIPNDYLINSREVRLKLLAGLIDTDGTVGTDGTRIVITQCLKHKKLVNGIYKLVKSLGFACSKSIRNTTWKHNGILKRGKAYYINISGYDVKDIPTLLPRKQCKSPKRRDTTGTGPLKIKPINRGEFVGLKLDGNKRFVLNDFTVTHNCNIYSTEFHIEIVDGKRKLKYTQQFTNNMFDKEEPIITKLKGRKKSYIKITYKPDYERFKLDGISDDVYSLFSKRIYDIAACTRPNVKVYLNDKLINITTFRDYILKFYSDDDIESRLIYEEVNDRWKVGVVFDSNVGYRHVSYVNGMCSFDGGSHVDHVSNQIVHKLSDMFKKKYKSVTVKNSYIRDNMTFFVDAVIVKPEFTSQLKEKLKSKVSEFGSRCDIKEDFIKQLAKTGLEDEVISYAQARNLAGMKKTDGKKTKSIKGLVKLDDAKYAGTRRSSECTLILTEGDSAKNCAVAGTEIIGNDYYGVFPLKGKLLNVREATAKQLLENEEIINIKKIMGLKQNKKYNDVKELRYGKILILTDQDSVTGDTPLLLNNPNGMIDIKTIDDLSSRWIKGDNGKEYSKTDYKIWTDNGWTEIKHIIRHKVEKKIYRVLTHTGIVDVTEDHSLLDSKKDKISPNECSIGTELLHGYPTFNDHQMKLPSDLSKYTVRQLWTYASALKIRYYQTIPKLKLIEMIKDRLIIESLELNKVCDITEDEAYVMGFFWADGTCGIYKWEHEYKNKNRPRAYITNRRSYSWGISNTNMNNLMKSKQIMEDIYPYEFKIIKCSKSNKLYDNKQLYKLILNGGIKTKPLINRYRKLFIS
jgi:hypothetical protein